MEKAQEKNTEIKKDDQQKQAKPSVSKHEARRKKRRHESAGQPPKGGIIFTIPLRDAFNKAHRKRVPYAARLVKDFVRTHTKCEEIKIGSRLNEKLWERGIKKPPRKIRVNVVKDGKIAKAELFGFEYQEFVAKKLEKGKGGLMERMKSRMTPKEIKKQEEEKLAGGELKPEQAAKAEKHKAEATSE
ncbi:MAG: 50S ribosomal protein L31e [Candidatus Aenigmatarchaeota archaeon]